MKIRRYLRGSGRVLAFVFVASVIWLLFDMAALRISINDANSQLLKERVGKERELIRQQSRVTQMAKRVFKHPVQGLDSAVTPVGNRPISTVIKQVYRYGGKGQDHMLKDSKVSSDLSDSIKHSDGATHHTLSHDVTPQQDAPAKKKAVNFYVNVTVAEATQVPQSVKTKKATLKKELIVTTLTEQKVLNNTESKGSEKTKDGHAKTQLDVVRTISRQTAIKDVHTEKSFKTEVKPAKTADVRVQKESPQPPVILQTGDASIDNATAVRKPGVHKVLALDVTRAPRDANAVGQFGQPVILASSEDEKVRKRWDEGHFNVYLSDQIPADRAIPDTRPET